MSSAPWESTQFSILLQLTSIALNLPSTDDKDAHNNDLDIVIAIAQIGESNSALHNHHTKTTSL